MQLPWSVAIGNAIDCEKHLQFKFGKCGQKASLRIDNAQCHLGGRDTCQCKGCSSSHIVMLSVSFGTWEGPDQATQTVKLQDRVTEVLVLTIKKTSTENELCYKEMRTGTGRGMMWVEECKGQGNEMGGKSPLLLGGSTGKRCQDDQNTACAENSPMRV